MSTAPHYPQQTGVPRRSPPPPVTWRSWPLEEGGGPMWLLLALTIVVATAVGLETASPRWALAACLLIGFASWRFFVPTYFELGPAGVNQEVFGRRRRLAWRDIGRCEICRQGVFVSAGRGLTSLVTGLYLPWGAKREEVLVLVDYYVVQARQEDRMYGFEVRN